MMKQVSKGDMAGEEEAQYKGAEYINFIYKAYAIIDNPIYEEIIHWSKSGNSFIIQTIDIFQNTILPEHFRHNRYQSFVRQLNMYDFHKVRSGDYYLENKAEFRHEHFKRDGYHHLAMIKRKGVKEKMQEKKKSTKCSRKNPKRKNCRKSKPIKKKESPKDNFPKKNPLFEVKKQKAAKEEKVMEEIEENSFGFSEEEEEAYECENSLSILVQNEHKWVNIEKVREQNRQIMTERVLQELKTHAISLNKLSDKVRLAEMIKQKWLSSFSEKNSDLETMKMVYYEIKRKLKEEEMRNKKEKEGEELLVLSDIGEEENIINSILKTQIKSTLIYINSETFLNNHHEFPNNRTFINI